MPEVSVEPDVELVRTSTHRRSTLGVLVVMVGLWVLLACLGRSVTIDRMSVVWPAGGMALLWFLVRDARPASVDTAVLAGSALVVNLAFGSSVQLALLGVVTSTSQTVMAVLLLRRWCPTLWGCGGTGTIDSPRVLMRYVGSLVAATLLGAAIGTVGLALLAGPADLLTATLWWGRNLCGALTLTTVGVLLARHLVDHRPHRSLRVAIGDTGGLVELSVVSVFTVAVYALVFRFADLPLIFAAVLATVWVGARFATWVGVVHACVVGVIVVVATLGGHGPFAVVDDPRMGSLLAQAFIATLVLTGLALSTARDENQALAAALRSREQEAVYQAQLLNAIVGSINEGITVVDADGAILFSNSLAADLLARTREGRADPGRLLTSSSFVVEGVEVPLEERPSARALRGEKVQDVEVTVREESSEWIMSMSASPLPPDEATSVARAVLLFRDATSEHARRAELSAFAGVVAHDLRNPLAAITGWTEMIAEDRELGELDPAILGRFIDRVRSSTGRMGELITDLLDYATSKDRDLVLGQVDLGLLVREVAVARGAEQHVLCGEIPPVDGDRVMLRQLVDNLVGNALKYVVPGTRPVVTVTGRIAGPGVVAVSVADNGIGLPAGQHEKVFAEFHRAHHRQYDGHGLGLAICRRIALRHGGEISAHDNPSGAGTVFELRLPSSVATLAQEIEQVFDDVESSTHGRRLEQAG